ncbi:hypoxanthine phosphoribosyltransferase [Clostridium formicaceticum]|uniref:Hypoxanthine phosphoribosyltransferase n=1 Tax=Clostridium formicaceticum TaxID=1497 RepID=A0AAC9WGI9_9CLOT|nr:hypoxanthine phosphoribosyltransferase [Clostridium formicaceticum]AOY77445.1 hypoxanthine phosphoribosyltransferase [Clostridium formicaceticum]ARE88002.1 Hypoxanthine-guanine phosphoribosyltransferase [Clostridium formicaceticum]
MEKDIKEVLFTKEAIQEKVKELGRKISEEYVSKEVIVIGVLKGANIFLGDLVREINIPLSIDFMAVSSYGFSTESSGVVRILKDLDLEIENKHVLIIEDIVDTGLTLKYLTENLKSRKAASLKICTLLDKPLRRKCDLNIDYVGFEIPDEFIVGYGIDFAEKYRNLPFIATLKKEVYE